MQESVAAVVLRGPEKESAGSVTLRTVPKEAALKKGAFAWGACWIVALVALPIPLVHFVAVPLCFVLGPILGFTLYKINSGATDITAGELPCPQCGKPVPLAPRAASFPSTYQCASCEARLFLYRK